MRKIVDRVLHQLGYVRWDRTIQGEVEWCLDSPTWVDLRMPGGQRVAGWVSWQR